MLLLLTALPLFAQPPHNPNSTFPDSCTIDFRHTLDAPAGKRGFVTLAKDGKFRKLTIQLVNPENNQPLKVMQNGKSIKYTVIAKAGYTAPRAVE